MNGGGLVPCLIISLSIFSQQHSSSLFQMKTKYCSFFQLYSGFYFLFSLHFFACMCFHSVFFLHLFVYIHIYFNIIKQTLTSCLLFFCLYQSELQRKLMYLCNQLQLKKKRESILTDFINIRSYMSKHQLISYFEVWHV